MKKIIVANWKCNPDSLVKAKKLFKEIKGGIICAPFPYIFKGVKGAQNCSWSCGPYTGEVCPKMLKDLGVKYVIIGHSERWIHLGEGNELANKKILALLKENMNPIVCIGETLEERKKKQTFKVLESELKTNLKNVSKAKIKNIILCYEPIWAISTTGKACSVDDAVTAILFMRKVVSKMYGVAIGKSIKIIYGGSANSKNAASFLQEVDGLLVGAASLKSKDFNKILKIAH